MAAKQTRAALELRRKNDAKIRIRDIWSQRMSIQYTDARKVEASEITQELEVTVWDEEFNVPGLNTHVCYPYNFFSSTLKSLHSNLVLKNLYITLFKFFLISCRRKA